MQRLIDDFPIERPKAAAIADFRQHDDGCRELGDGITGERPFGGLPDQLDQDQADDKSGGRADDLLDRIDPDMVVNTGALADIEIERACDHISDGCDEKPAAGIGGDHEAGERQWR